MTLIDDLIANLSEDAPVRSVLVGEHWTVVCSRHCGISATLRSDHREIAAPLKAIDGLEKSARELAEWAYSTDLLEASIGVAAINSMLDIDQSLTVEINASEVLTRCGQGKNVALVGRFRFVQQLRQAARRLWILEQHPGEDEYPAGSAVDLLPQADVVAITGSALVNHTLDELLALCPPHSTVVVLGPSTPFSPVLFRHGVTILSGARVADESAVLRTAGQAISLRQIEGLKLLTQVRNEK